MWPEPKQQYERAAKDAIDAIYEHWTFQRQIPKAVADDMKNELTMHLEEAFADGKKLEDVVGSDLRQFADDWASSVAPSRWLTRVKLAMFLIATVVSAVTLSNVIITRSLELEVPIVPGMLVVLVGLGYVYFVPRSRIGSGPKPRSRSNAALNVACVWLHSTHYASS